MPVRPLPPAGPAELRPNPRSEVQSVCPVAWGCSLHRALCHTRRSNDIFISRHGSLILFILLLGAGFSPAPELQGTGPLGASAGSRLRGVPSRALCPGAIRSCSGEGPLCVLAEHGDCSWSRPGPGCNDACVARLAAWEGRGVGQTHSGWCEDVHVVSDVWRG